jgi:serine-type D-Ala-D-Ala carboxypeptidase (penicillin-binding protein 5/6)
MRALARQFPFATIVALACAAPASTTGAGHMPIAASAYVAIEAGTGHVILGRNEDVQRPIASLTKVMTGLLVIERGHLSQRVRVTRQAASVEAYREGLVVGYAYRRLALLWSSLLVSSNDSATALAIDDGRGSLGRFYAAMNAKARALGMRQTRYASASGLDDTRNLSTALDQARLARAALRSRLFATIVSTRVHRSPWPTAPHTKVWVNHNKMLGWVPGTYGVKTGWTTRAGGCVIIAQKRGAKRVIAVVLGSPSIWSDMATLLDRAFARMSAGPPPS